MPGLNLLRRAWLRFLRHGLDFDIALLRDQLERIREDLYDLEARRHSLDVELMHADREAAR